MAVGRRPPALAIQARPIPEGLTVVVPPGRLRVEPRPRALGFEAVWVEFGIPRGFRLPEALRFPRNAPSRQHRRRENNSQCDDTHRTARVKADRSVCEFDPTSATRGTTIPRNPPSTLWIRLGVPFTAARQPG